MCEGGGGVEEDWGRAADEGGGTEEGVVAAV